MNKVKTTKHFYYSSNVKTEKEENTRHLKVRVDLSNTLYLCTMIVTIQ